MTTVPGAQDTVSRPRLQGCPASGNATRSLLALGHMGWIQMINLILTGAMTVADGIGVRRAVSRPARAGGWAPATGLYRRARLDEPGPAGPAARYVQGRAAAGAARPWTPRTFAPMI